MVSINDHDALIIFVVLSSIGLIYLITVPFLTVLEFIFLQRADPLGVALYDSFVFSPNYLA